MRICVLTWRDLKHPEAGGAEVYTEQVLRRWAEAGHEVTMVTSRVADAPAAEFVDGYRVLRMGGKYTVYRQARAWWQHTGSQKGFDVVLDMINTVPFQAHRWVKGVPTVGFIHQTCEEIWAINTPWPASSVGRYLLEPYWLRDYRDVPVLAVSASTRDSIRRFGVQDVTVVPEGYEPPTIENLPAKEDVPTLVWCARVVDYKRPYDVLEATSRVRTQIPDLKVWMIGGGPLLEQLRADAPPWMEVLGFVDQDEKFDRMARAHVHVATSVREGWGLVVSEAAALGTPTIGYDVPGLRDSTRAANGVVIPPSPDALADWLPPSLAYWREHPFAPLPYGGAHSWDTVATEVMTAMLAKAGLTATPVK
ncbi:MAG TPA: glycosyltransferase family 4 protein [Actinomycetota bacterium]|nr:glycosyltransferase family 4 protein [Actinomycetota bacterium]